MVVWLILMFLSLFLFGFTDGMLQGFIGLFMILCFAGFIASLMDLMLGVTIKDVRKKWDR